MGKPNRSVLRLSTMREQQAEVASKHIEVQFGDEENPKSVKFVRSMWLPIPLMREISKLQESNVFDADLLRKFATDEDAFEEFEKIAVAGDVTEIFKEIFDKTEDERLGDSSTS